MALDFAAEFNNRFWAFAENIASGVDEGVRLLRAYAPHSSLLQPGVIERLGSQAGPLVYNELCRVRSAVLAGDAQMLANAARAAAEDEPSGANGPDDAQAASSQKEKAAEAEPTEVAEDRAAEDEPSEANGAGNAQAASSHKEKAAEAEPTEVAEDVAAEDEPSEANGAGNAQAASRKKKKAAAADPKDVAGGEKAAGDIAGEGKAVVEEDATRNVGMASASGRVRLNDPQLKDAPETVRECAERIRQLMPEIGGLHAKLRMLPQGSHDEAKRTLRMLEERIKARRESWKVIDGWAELCEEIARHKQR